MPKTANPTPAELVDRAFSRCSEITALLAEQLEDEKAICALGAGKHSGAVEGNVLTVVAARPGRPGAITYGLPEGGEKRAREICGPDKFGILFRRVISYEAIEGVEHVAPTHLSRAKARDLLAHLTRVGKGSAGSSAYILWPKAKE